LPLVFWQIFFISILKKYYITDIVGISVDLSAESVICH